MVQRTWAQGKLCKILSASHVFPVCYFLSTVSYTAIYKGKKFLTFNPIQTGGGGLFEPLLRQNRDNSYTERAMTFKFSDFS